MTIINGIMEAFEEAAQTINVEEEEDDQDECPAELLISQEKLADLCAEVSLHTAKLFHTAEDVGPICSCTMARASKPARVYWQISSSM